MSCGAMKVSCEDGFSVETKDRHELVALTQWHLERTHHRRATEADVLGMAKHP